MCMACLLLVLEKYTFNSLYYKIITGIVLKGQVNKFVLIKEKYKDFEIL
jgi:hypothetical protein